MLIACGARSDLDVFVLASVDGGARATHDASASDVAHDAMRDVAALDATGDAASDVAAIDAPLDAPADVATLDAGGDAPAEVGTFDAGPPTTTCVLFVAGPPALAPSTWLWNGTMWNQAGPETSPGTRSYPLVSTLEGQVVLVGGVGGVPGPDEPDTLNDTWVWSGSTWTQQHPTQLPPAFVVPAGAALHGKLVVFGLPKPGAPSETWTWDGNNWSQQSPAQSPPSRVGACAVTLGDRLFLFGGRLADLTDATDLWAWDGADWTSLSPGSSPDDTNAVAANVSDTIVMFSGDSGDTWAFGGTTWAELMSSVTPPRRSGAAGGTLGDTFVLFGGLGGTGNPNPAPLDDTWVWTGTQWTQAPGAGPPATYGPAMSCY
jgi:hypothetical protein